MDHYKIIEEVYHPYPEAKKYLLAHSKAVTKKALKLADKHSDQVNPQFIEEAAMVHDIGIYTTHAPHIGCYGEESYIRHGIIGRELLGKYGYPEHGLIAERHIGVGLTAEDIQEQQLPLPLRDMNPQTLEEEIIAYADLFFSKSRKPIHKEKNISQIKKGLSRFGQDQVKRFEEWVKKFGR